MRCGVNRQERNGRGPRPVRPTSDTTRAANAAQPPPAAAASRRPTHPRNTHDPRSTLRVLIIKGVRRWLPLGGEYAQRF